MIETIADLDVGESAVFDHGAGGVHTITRIADANEDGRANATVGVVADDVCSAGVCGGCGRGRGELHAVNCPHALCEMCRERAATIRDGECWVCAECHDGMAKDAAAVDAFDAWSDAATEAIGNYLDRAMSRPRDGGLSAEIARAADDLVSACEGAPLLVRLLPEAPKLGHALADKATRTLDAAATAVAMHNEATARGIAWDDVEHVIADYLGDDERVRMARAVRGAKR